MRTRGTINNQTVTATDAAKNGKEMICILLFTEMPSHQDGNCLELKGIYENRRGVIALRVQLNCL